MEAVKRGKLNLIDHDAVFHDPYCFGFLAIRLLRRIFDLTYYHL